MAPPQTKTSRKCTVRRPAAVVTSAAARPTAVDDQAVDSVVREQAGAGRLGSWEVGLGHAAAPPLAGVGPGGVVHPAGTLVVTPPEPLGTTAQRLAGGQVGARHGLHGELLLHLVARGVDVGRVEVVDGLAPAVEHVLRRTPVQAAVDLGPATGAAALGVGDGRGAERRSDPAGTVLAIHLVERERHGLALADERSLLDHEHVVAGLGEQARPSARRRHRTRSRARQSRGRRAAGSCGSAVLLRPSSLR